MTKAEIKKYKHEYDMKNREKNKLYKREYRERRNMKFRGEALQIALELK